MSGDSTPHRNEGRFYIKSEATRVTVTFTGPDGTLQRLHGQLADLSLRGVRVDLDGKIEPEQAIDLQIEVPSESLNLERTAVVCWQQPRDAKSWWTGCELDTPFDQTIVERLASARVLNRRRDARYELDKRACVRTELSHTIHEVRLVNYSKGGFCVLFDQPVELPHERLMLMVERRGEPVTIPARVMWSRPVGNAYGVGCAFSSMDGFVHLREYAEPKAARSRLPRISRPKTVSSWIAMCMAITIALQISWVMRTQPELGDAIRHGWSAWIVQPLRDQMKSFDGQASPPSEQVAQDPRDT